MYEVVSALGAGGMGEVYLARDGRLHRDVAIKIIPDAFAADRDRLVRFEREAQVLASLNHTHIAHIYGLEDFGTSRALVMEYVPGRTLAQALANSPRGLPLDEALSIARQIADGLEAAHERGIVHRDLKPGNVMLTTDDQVKILDFGLARVVEPGTDIDPSNSPTVTVGTQAGVILGTVAYMSPEQAKGRTADKRSDIWSFGCVLYEMLTGAATFNGDSVSDTLANVLKTDVDWNRLPAGLPRAVRVCLERCLTRDRHERLGDMSTVKFLLSSPAGLTGGPVENARPASRWRERAIWVAAAIVLAAAAGAAAWRLKPAPVESRVTTRFQHGLGDGQRFAVSRSVAIAPDGRTIAYSAAGRLYVRAMADLEAHAVPGTDDDPLAPVFSPDGRWIAYVVRGLGTLKKVAVAGGVPVALATLPTTATDLSWQGTSIVFGLAARDYWGIYAIGDGGGDLRSLVPLNSAVETVQQAELIDDSHVLFTLRRLDVPANAGGNSIVIQQVGSKDRKTLVANGTSAHILPSGHLAFLGTGGLRVAPFDPVRLELTGEPVLLQPGVTASYSVSRNGTLVYASPTQDTRTMVWVDRQGREQAFQTPLAGQFDVRFSPNGKQVALCSGADIYVWSIEKETSTRLTLTPNAVEYNPAWTADGRYVLFDWSDGGARKIVRKASDGSGPTEDVTNAAGYPEAISPDGRFLVYHTQTNIGMLQPLDSKEPARPLVATKAQAYNADISRDGRWITYQSDESGRFEVYVQPFPALGQDRWQVSDGGGAHPLFAANGRELFFIDSKGTLTSVPVEMSPTFAKGKATPLFGAGQYFVNVARDYDVTPDGNRFVFVKVLPQAARVNLTVITDWFEEVKARVVRK